MVHALLDIDAILKNNKADDRPIHTYLSQYQVEFHYQAASLDPR